MSGFLEAEEGPFMSNDYTQRTRGSRQSLSRPDSSKSTAVYNKDWVSELDFQMDEL